MQWNAAERRRAVRLLVAAAVAAAGAVLAWRALVDPAVPFLAARSPAEWILYPTPLDLAGKPAVELETVFRRELMLAQAPRTARLAVRWFRTGSVWINGRQAAVGAGSWKDATEVDVAGLLRAGANEIVARAGNDSGPPALWLALAAGEATLASDISWQASLAGASERPARLAREPLTFPESRSTPQPRPLAALRANLPSLLFFAALTLAALAAARALRGAAPERDRELLGPREAVVLFALAALAWGVLFWNDRHLSPRWGFDAAAHQDYVRIVLEEHRLPLADEGWETYQPPLYYALAAGLLAAAGHARLDEPGTLELLRGLGWLIGVLHLAAILASLRLLFEDRRRPVVAGLVLAAALPAGLYLSLYVTNEPLQAALVSWAIFLALRILRHGSGGWRAHAALGAVLGLALLAKVSALIPATVIVGVLAARRLLAAGERRAAAFGRSVGVLVVACALVCGWHYARVVARFGTPIVGNWDRVAGFAWWQAPGYRTRGELVRFGRALEAPLFSAVASLPDAVYSTLWGDGMVGGSIAPSVRPPWNYGWMAAGYVLALPWSLALLGGLGLLAVRLARAPGAADLLLLGTIGGTAFAQWGLALRLPFYASTKAFYGLAALVPLAVCGALAYDALARRGRLVRVGLAVLLGVWGLTAWASYWIPGGGDGEPSAAALAALDPGGLVEGSARAEHAGDTAAAVALARRATELEPDHRFAWMQLGSALVRSGASGEAVAALREALRVDPHNGVVHERLAALYSAQGDATGAAAHAAMARRIEAAQARPAAAATTDGDRPR